MLPAPWPVAWSTEVQKNEAALCFIGSFAELMLRGLGGSTAVR